MKQKTFKEYAAAKKANLHPFATLKYEVTVQQYPNMETVFGSHSVKSDQQFPNMETSFGSHSVGELQEEVSTTPGKITTADQIAQHKPAEEKSIHDSNKIKHSNSMGEYTIDSTHINTALHEKKIRPTIAAHIRNIDATLNKSKLDRDTHVYTGLKDSPAKHFTGSGSAKVHLPAYTSTSTKCKIAKNFTVAREQTKEEAEKHTPINAGVETATGGNKVDHVLKLHLPKGTKAGSVKHFAAYENENEILLHRGHNIEIHPHPTIDKDGTHVWHARIISHTPTKV